MITICVYLKSNGKLVQGSTVTVIDDSFFGGTKRDTTNREGEVHLDMNPCQGRVLVDGREVFKGQISGRTMVYKE